MLKAREGPKHQGLLKTPDRQHVPRGPRSVSPPTALREPQSDSPLSRVRWVHHFMGDVGRETDALERPSPWKADVAHGQGYSFRVNPYREMVSDMVRHMVLRDGRDRGLVDFQVAGGGRRSREGVNQ